MLLVILILGSLWFFECIELSVGQYQMVWGFDGMNNIFREQELLDLLFEERV